MSYRDTPGPERTLALTLVSLASPAAAQVDITPLADVRLRHEAVDQAGMPNDAHALTARARVGVQAVRDRLSAIVEGEATVEIDRRFNDGFNGRTGYPLIPDADNIELNRVQLRYAYPRIAVSAGRQIIELADQRFVGSASFRQNQQTFDAARVQWKPLRGVDIDASYAWSVRTPTGSKGYGVRPQSIPGDNLFVLVNYTMPIATLTSFAYVIDQDLPLLQGFRLQSQTYGVRIAGSRPIGGGVRLSYVGSYARQSDHHRNPNDYAVDYYLVDATLSRARVAGTIGYEVLGASNGLPFTSFQAPDSSAFRFQGWAGRFITTPADGVRDRHASFTSTWKRSGPVNLIGVTFSGHRFEADRLKRHYGDEIDALLSARVGHTTLAARYAHYDADRYATDVTRFWLSAEWTL